MCRARKQYLARYAEPEARQIGSLGRSFGHALTIPAYGEGRELRDALSSIPSGPLGDVLIVLVVNARADSPPAMRAANSALLEDLRALLGCAVPIPGNAALFEHPRGALLLVDRATPGRELPPRQGVGLARKIGADIALALWSDGGLISPWIHCTDADVSLPSDYFAAATRQAPASAIDPCARAPDPCESPAALRSARARAGWPGSARGASDAAGAALLDPFRHIGDDPDALEYEISLRYYVAGLRHAGSPYAFHTIGSALAVHTEAYARVRGFPKRLAAEDFYLLNKLAKVGAIRRLRGEPIRLSARTSSRTPFGTGRALARARERERTTPIHVYHPDAFCDLGAWLQTLRALADADARADLGRLLAASAADWPRADAERLRAQLEASGAWAAALAGARRGRSPDARAKHLRNGFDAFRTLKLIHALRDAGRSSIPLDQALTRAPFVSAPAHAALPAIRERLAAAEP